MSDPVELLQKYVDRAKNLQPALSKVGDWWQDEESVRQFQSQTAPDGQRWKPLTEGYKEWKRKNRYLLAVGTRTGDMFNARSYQIRGGRNIVVLSYPTDYAQDFDKVRPLFPRRQLPKRWSNAIERQIKNHIRGVNRG